MCTAIHTTVRNVSPIIADVAIGKVGMASEAYLVGFNVWLYDNPSVVASEKRAERLRQLISSASGFLPGTASTQPSLYDAIGYVIPATRGSYYDAERLASDRLKLRALSDFVRSGSALVLLDGFKSDAATNTFLPLLSALLGRDPRCMATSVGKSMHLRKRTAAQAFANLSDTAEPMWHIYPKPNVPNTLALLNQVKPMQGFSFLSCQTGQAIYSTYVNQEEFAASMMWKLGSGVIYWIGSSFFRPFTPGVNSVACVVWSGWESWLP
ncbi:hypothetical protein VOLCADRAFT_89354 [Volvox carteri f. nagariensis]|uniref:Uncharacterized protein n=1 Tax=Volvox carteri f. nagariensis TaxID=3068 RepID=D8TRH5_VOLCA|nr:uncharacterized protein VOLCADRAFT_89354 [Volvox carteri f. nagariensis]EFJ49994.1 hypothetical protein VOLCADRAFT_89354 [Volvox carteri f. nagariensis]|eukprot:XP_002949059.1 hypothetical protein VOLCADRAFT_89354 [Volvox carteri f. nagariensis]